MSAPSRHLVHRREARFEDVLGDHRRAVRNRVQGDDHRLEIGGKSRVRQGDDVDGARPLVEPDLEAVDTAVVEATDLGTRGDRSLSSTISR